MDGPEGQIARPMYYGTGMRGSEALRVQELAFDCTEMTVRAEKGEMDRRVPLPGALKAELHRHLTGRRRQYEADRRQGRREVACRAS